MLDSAGEHPDRPALVTAQGTITYRELDERTNRLARHLIAVGLTAGETVAVATPRPADVVVAALAALKAGGAHAVVDPGAPMDELARLLTAARATVVVTDAALRPRVDDGAGRRVVLPDAEADAIAACSPDPLDAVAEGPAAVLFTAGTTGRRRAVVVDHGRLRAVYAAWAEVLGLLPTDRHLVTALPDTAAFTGGWLRALWSGGTLVLPEGSAAGADGITVLDTDPATAAVLLDPAPATLRLVTVGGERLTVAEQVRLQDRLAPGARLVQVYGTAEDVGSGTWFETDLLAGPVADAERVAILGRPFPGGRVEIHDGEIRLFPPGPGAAVDTGDLGVLRPDGLVEFRGRSAHRAATDPYPAEAALAAHPGVREAVIVPADEGGPVAYVVPVAGRRLPTPVEVRAHLSGVPERELPRRVVLLGALPRNRAGKVDRRLLPLPVSGAAARGGGKGGAPMTGAEWSVAWRWLAAVLSLPAAALLTGVLWPGSTDLSGVPQPWATLFTGLYLAEFAAFAAGVGFLLLGRAPMLRQGRSPALTTAAHLAIVWLLVSWWPQDNLYRLALKDDWPRQAALTYTFNVTLMLAALVVAVYATRRPRPAG